MCWQLTAAIVGLYCMALSSHAHRSVGCTYEWLGAPCIDLYIRRPCVALMFRCLFALRLPGAVPTFSLSTTFVLNGVANNVNSAAFAVATVDLDKTLCWVRKLLR